MKRIPKSSDISQAFVQSVLPEDKKYVIKPPHGCPITPDKTYLLLKRTVYSLKCSSPRHWYETCEKTLIKLGLQPCPNAPCIFSGTLIIGEPLLYLGLFVDFIYFSASDKVGEKFKNDFGSEYKVDFQDKITDFLGMKFASHVDIYMNQPADIRDLIIKKAGLHMPQSLSA